MTISGMVTLITGGSSGIGKQLAIDMAKLGARVIISSHDSARLKQACSEINSMGYEVTAMACDVTRQADIDGMVARVGAEYGGLDILVNNAGYAVYESFEESDLGEIVRLIDVNLLGCIRCMKGFLPSMIARRSGRIINVASIAGKLIITPNATYGAAKHGMLALSEALKYELGYWGIKVSVVCPGRVETPFFDHETFRERAPRAETKFTVPVEKVSKKIIQAIERERFVTYVPFTLGLLVWLANAFPFIMKPLFGRLLTSRIHTLYASMNVRKMDAPCFSRK